MSQVQSVHYRQSTHIAVAVMAFSALFTTVQIQASNEYAAPKPDAVSADIAKGTSKTRTDKDAQTVSDAGASLKAKAIAKGRSPT